MPKPKAVAIISGGLDSTVLAYKLKRDGYDLHLVSFNYGQRHRRELEFAAITARRLGVRHDIVNLTGITALLGGSALTDPAVDVPEGHYAADNMRLTVVPNRNSIMLSIAVGAAISDQAECVATAIHAGDHAVYPDCRPAFRDSFEQTMLLANEGFIDPHFRICTPFVQTTKAAIVTIGQSYGVPFRDTYSCYQGLEYHCGSCGTCVERIEAFRVAGVEDPTDYDQLGLAKYEELRAAGTVQ